MKHSPWAKDHRQEHHGRVTRPMPKAPARIIFCDCCGSVWSVDSGGARLLLAGPEIEDAASEGES